MVTQKAPTDFKMIAINGQSKSKACGDLRRANSLLRPFQLSTKFFDNIKLEALPNTSIRVILGLRSRRAMTCEVISRWIPLENHPTKLQESGLLYLVAMNSSKFSYPEAYFGVNRFVKEL